jgi:two-component system NtrC family sensor kinase
LQSGTVDPHRRADLEEVVRLACQEIASIIRSAHSDVLVLDRQTTVVQSILTEQMCSARNEHVIEPVRLTELISQSLEIVPDGYRQRLNIELDDSLKRIGVVQVARTVLRLVLQNLIINAAEAVRVDTSRKGTLRIGATLTGGADHSELQLYCSDDGVGIAPGDCERIFEKGFSTKSVHGNRGIGLHWCANALHALGGRIWAVSDGPGMGASLHVLIPLVYEAAALAGAA